MPHDCTDGFLGAYWRRPEAYLDPAVRAAISGLALVDSTRLRPGLERLAHDLRTGAWRRRNAAILEAGELDLGYRLVVAGSP